MRECHFWENIMLRQPYFRASRASIAQKSRGLRVVLFQKLFKGYIFCFLGHSVRRYVFELFVCKTNLKKKCSVWCTMHQVHNIKECKKRVYIGSSFLCFRSNKERKTQYVQWSQGIPLLKLARMSLSGVVVWSGTRNSKLWFKLSHFFRILGLIHV